MQILIELPDSLSTEKIDRIIEKIENQLEAVTYSIKLEGIPTHEAELANKQGIKKLLDWCDRHPYTLTDDGIASREKVMPRKVFAHRFEVDRINIPNRDSLHDR